jgi:hypothetical protein
MKCADETGKKGHQPEKETHMWIVSKAHNPHTVILLVFVLFYVWLLIKCPDSVPRGHGSG